MPRRRFKLWAGLIAGIALLSAAAAAVLFLVRSPAPPNVLLITLDTTRADRLGCYGYAAARTTAIDALASEGVLFEKAYVTVPLTLPSHASMLTGLYPPENGLSNNGPGRLGDGIPTLAETLARAGYRTGAFIGAVVLHSMTGLDRGFDVYNDDMAGGERHGDETHLMRNGRKVVDAALAWLKADDRRTPFFCWVHLFDPHAPYEGHPEVFGDRFRDRPYDGDIAFADLQVGRLVQHLKDSGLYDRTLIIVAGDHGEGLGEHDELEHGFMLYNSTLRVPLIVTSPDLCRAGHRVASPVSLIDLFPTVLDCLQIGSEARVSGVSLRGALQGGDVELRSFYSETIAPFASYGWAPLRCVTTDSWKYVQTTRDELYNLQHDPDERQNLVESEPEQVEILRQELADLRALMVPVEPTDRSLSDAERQALASLGYTSDPGAAASHADAALPDVKDMIVHYNAEIEARKLLYAGQVEQAMTRLRKVIEAAPDFMPARLTLGAGYQIQNQLDEAAAVYEDALRVRPDSHDAHFDLAKLCQSRGDTDRAIEHYRAAIAHNPMSAMAHVNLATLLFTSGDRAGARAHYERGLEAFPDSTVGHFNYGVFLAEEGDLEGAVAHVRRAAELSPGNAQIHYQLGLYLVALGRSAEAAGRFAEALRLNPRFPGAAEQLERLRMPAAAVP